MYGGDRGERSGTLFKERPRADELEGDSQEVEDQEYSELDPTYGDV